DQLHRRLRTATLLLCCRLCWRGEFADVGQQSHRPRVQCVGWYFPSHDDRLRPCDLDDRALRGRPQPFEGWRADRESDNVDGLVDFLAVRLENSPPASTRRYPPQVIGALILTSAKSTLFRQSHHLCSLRDSRGSGAGQKRIFNLEG